MRFVNRHSIVKQLIIVRVQLSLLTLDIRLGSKGIPLRQASISFTLKSALLQLHFMQAEGGSNWPVGHVGPNNKMCSD